MARLYANENFPLPVVEGLREFGHDVLTTTEAGRHDQALADEDVLALGDEWQGPGAFIALDGKAIAESASRFEWAVLGVMVHEIAHVAPVPERVIDPPDLVATHRLKEWEQMKLLRALTKIESFADNVDHDHRFIRRAIHLFVRATLHGFDIPFYSLLTWSQAEHYLHILLREAVEMRDATFAEIEALPAPAALIDQWTDDCENYDKFFLNNSADKP